MASAFFLALGIGLAAAVCLTFTTAWRLRNGPAAPSKRFTSVVFVVLLGAPLVLAIAMPNFKTALVVWLGYVVGFGISHFVTLPLGYVLARRIERRQIASHRADS
jgi:putative Ca2+/H+ antiporter (TMEM165/GDT1 family)